MIVRVTTHPHWIDFQMKDTQLVITYTALSFPEILEYDRGFFLKIIQSSEFEADIVSKVNILLDS